MNPGLMLFLFTIALGVAVYPFQKIKSRPLIRKIRKPGAYLMGLPIEKSTTDFNQEMEEMQKMLEIQGQLKALEALATHPLSQSDLRQKIREMRDALEIRARAIKEHRKQRAREIREMWEKRAGERYKKWQKRVRKRQDAWEKLARERRDEKHWYEIIPPQIFVKAIISIVILGSALFLILGDTYDPDSEKWAIGTIGLMVGYWLRGY